MNDRIKLTSFEEAWEVWSTSPNHDLPLYEETFYAGAYAALGVFANRLAANSTTSIQELSEELSKAITELERIIGTDEVR